MIHSHYRRRTFICRRIKVISIFRMMEHIDDLRNTIETQRLEKEYVDGQLEEMINLNADLKAQLDAAMYVIYLFIFWLILNGRYF